MPRRFCRFTIFGILLILCGCGGGSEPTASVSGTVTLDGTPIAKGNIYFIREGNPPDILEITNGSYSGNVAVGKRKVKINAYKPGKISEEPTPMVKGDVPLENYIPAKYNAKSEITKEVQAGSNVFDFKLTKE